MADQKQLDLLKQGVTNWNIWRKQHPEIRLGLSEADLSEADLSEADLNGADLRQAQLWGANLQNTHLSHADLRQADLSGARLKGADLSGANLHNIHLSRVDLRQANLSGANLSRVDLRQANLRGADLSGAILHNTCLSGAYLNEADLSGAHLRGSDLSHTNFGGAHLNEADLSGARVGETVFGNVDLRTVKGLETVRHYSPSTIGTDTLLRSVGDIPETFLREAGLTDAFITYTRSLVQNPIEYYTCFISYSAKDQTFAERLYADLQAKDVRCWYAPEDVKIGDEFRTHIDEAIHLYDKLIVILSEHSIESSWVEYEVNKAQKKEQEQGRPVLFPIKLDETVMETPEAWAAAIRKKRHIGDFVRWKEHDAYQAAFERLLRDLQANTIPPIKAI